MVIEKHEMYENNEYTSLKNKDVEPVDPVQMNINQSSTYRKDLAARSTSLDMTVVFHARRYGRFIEMQNNLKRKKLHRTNQSSNFLGGSFSIRDTVRVPIQFIRERQP